MRSAPATSPVSTPISGGAETPWDSPSGFSGFLRSLDSYLTRKGGTHENRNRALLPFHPGPGLVSKLPAREPAQSCVVIMGTGIDHRIIGAIIIKHKLNLSDEETVLQIQENPYLQYLLGYSSYEAKTVFSPTLFVEIRKRVGSEKFAKMSLKIIETSIDMKNQSVKCPSQKSKKSEKSMDQKEGSDENKSENKGKMLVDATVAEQAIKYPNDLELLNDSRMEAERIIDQFYKLSGSKIKPRTYRKIARKEFLSTAKKKRKTRRELRKADL